MDWNVVGGVLLTLAVIGMLLYVYLKPDASTRPNRARRR